MSEPNDPQAPPIDPELVRARQQTQLEVWQENQHASVEIRRAQAEAELHAAVESGLYQRLAWARAVAQSDLVPAGFRAKRKPTGEFYDGEVEKAAASIVLAQEWGDAIGLGGMKALMHLQVIEGNIGVKPASARGLMESKGVIIEDEWTYSDYGEPVGCVTTALRPGREKPNTAEYTIGDAERDRLCTTERDDTGQVKAVRARGGANKDKVLPWEKRTKDMLMWRATSRLVRAHYQDMVGGMEFTSDMEPETEEAPPPPPLSDAAAGMLQRVASQRADRESGDGYDPTADLALFTADDPWWNHAGAQVTRRSKKQMAADRLATAERAGDDRIPQPPTGEPEMEIDPETGLPATMVQPVDFDDSPETTTPGNPNPIEARLAEEPIETSPPEPEALTLPVDQGVLEGEEGWPEPPADWNPAGPPAPETREQLLTRLDDTITAIDRPREEVLARFYVLFGGRHEDSWTDDEIRDTVRRLNQ